MTNSIPYYLQLSIWSNQCLIFKFWKQHKQKPLHIALQACFLQPRMFYLYSLKFLRPQIYLCFSGSTKPRKLSFYPIFSRMKHSLSQHMEDFTLSRKGWLHMELDQLTILTIVIQIYIIYLLSDVMKLYTWFRTTLLGRVVIFSMTILCFRTIVCFVWLMFSLVVSTLIENIDIVW